MRLTLQAGQLLCGIYAALPAAAGWLSFAHFLANWGFREAVLFLVLMNIFLARSLIFSFLVLLLDCLALQDFKLVNLLPQILPFLPGDGVLGCLTGTSKGRGVGRGADEAL